MKIGSILAIYTLFWVMGFFLALPFGVKTDEEVGKKSLPGHAESAPHHFHFGRQALRATILSALMFGLFYGNYILGGVGVDALDWIAP
jgi:predicted secreted protein